MTPLFSFLSFALFPVYIPAHCSLLVWAAGRDEVFQFEVDEGGVPEQWLSVC